MQSWRGWFSVDCYFLPQLQNIKWYSAHIWRDKSKGQIELVKVRDPCHMPLGYGEKVSI